jgi:uroporphyrin-III C-methyltransferase/precorrin-2 dehydrogenase/sirohydrochlorin ferrochelatase
MFYLPLYHNLTQAQVLVVGGGETALRKMRWLLRAGAKIKVVTLTARDEVQALAADGAITLELRGFRATDLVDELTLIVSATNNKEVNRSVHREAVARNILINCVDQPELCTVIFPAIIDRSPIIATVSSMGRSPTLARVVRGWIEARLAPNLTTLVSLADALRDAVRSKLATVAERKVFWERLFASRSAEQALQGDLAAAIASGIEQLEQTTITGSVSLVGAGPGDPELITLKAHRLLQQADVILYDKLANPRILDYARRDAERIYVGKQGPKPASNVPRPDSRSTQQQDINALIVHHARAGRHVVRLKGGDPFIYGRGGEEIEAVVDAGLSVEVVPGITAAFGAASIAGIPLTYRNLSQSVRFITGHRIENTINLDWPELGREEQTLVIYMGLVGLEQLLAKLLEHGCDPATPAALIENATMPEQRMVFAEVSNLAREVRQAAIDGPSVVIIGAVVAKAPRYQTSALGEEST